MDFEKYKNTLNYPKKPEKKCEICKTPFLEKHKYCTECGVNLNFYERKMENYKNERKKYGEHEANLLEQFKTDALDEVGLTGHPKADKAYSFAWEHGHSAGLQEVYNWLEEASELILD